MKNKEEATIRLSMKHFPVTALGPGVRAGLWTQGCSIGCKGCISPHAADPSAGYEADIAGVAEWLEECFEAGARGLTVSGGEPFDQPPALELLLEAASLSGYNDILIYSGYQAEWLEEAFPEVMRHVSALVDGPFKQGEITDSSWRGSGNQRLTIYSSDPEVRSRYLEFEKRSGARELQVAECDGRIFVIGIPRQEDSEEIRRMLSEEK